MAGGGTFCSISPINRRTLAAITQKALGIPNLRVAGEDTPTRHTRTRLQGLHADELVDLVTGLLRHARNDPAFVFRVDANG